MRINTFNFLKVIYITLIVIAVFVLPARAAYVSEVELQVSNSSPFSMEVLVKCDVIPGKGTFTFEKKYTLPKKKITNVRISNAYHHCQIWPRLKLLGD